MNIQAEVSLYPLRSVELSGPIEAFCETLARRGLKVQPGSMSTHISGDSDAVFAALREAFAGIAREQQVVLVVKLSNCCPEDSERDAGAHA